MENQEKTARTSDRHMIQIDGLRCLAITTVAWSHWAPGKWQFGLPFGTGVQLFFVISGFLITGILIDNNRGATLYQTWRRFYARRALRIFPLFYMTIGVCLLLNVNPIRATWPWHVCYLSNFFYVSHGGLVHHSPPGMSAVALDHFAHFWSLAVEEQFYLFWPFLVLLLPARRVEKILWVLILIAPLMRILSGEVVKRDMIHVLSWSNLDALGIGGLFATLLRIDKSGLRTQRLSRFCLLIGLPAAVIGGALAAKLDLPFTIETMSHTGLNFFYGWLVFSAAGGIPGIAGAFLGNRFIVYLGRISYGLYILHLFTPLIVRWAARELGMSEWLSHAVVPILIAQGVVTVALAMLSWHCFEKPLNDLKRFFPYHSPTTTRPDRQIRRSDPQCVAALGPPGEGGHGPTAPQGHGLYAPSQRQDQGQSAPPERAEPKQGF
jgi:peptidoglycan/LPS O-acetylase OafA/YrhL